MAPRNRARISAFDAQLPILFINRTQDRERRRCLEGELAGAGVSAERIAAVEGLAVPPELASYFWDSDRSASRLSPGEVGC